MNKYGDNHEKSSIKYDYNLEKLELTNIEKVDQEEN